MKAHEINLNEETINSLIANVKQKSEKSEWIIIGPIEVLPIDILNQIKNKSLSKNKKFKNIIHLINKKGVNVNRFNKVLRLFNISNIKLTISEREKEIIIARKKWKELNSTANKALLEYKTIKGDFYKK